MITALAIVAAGFGALARYGLAGAVQRHTGSSHPWGTAVVNVTGAALLGVLLALHATGRASETVVTVVGIGSRAGSRPSPPGWSNRSGSPNRATHAS